MLTMIVSVVIVMMFTAVKICILLFFFFTRVDACIVVILSCVEFEEKRCFLHAF